MGSRIEAARRTGFFRDALRTLCRLLSLPSPPALPSPAAVLVNVDATALTCRVLFVRRSAVLRRMRLSVGAAARSTRWPLRRVIAVDAIAAGDRASLPRAACAPYGPADCTAESPQAAAPWPLWRQDRPPAGDAAARTVPIPCSLHRR